MSESAATSGDETDNTTVEATLNITTRTDGEEVERQANNRSLTTTCGLTRRAFAFRVCAVVIPTIIVILLEVRQPGESTAVRDLSTLLLEYALNLTQHGSDS